MQDEGRSTRFHHGPQSVTTSLEESLTVVLQAGQQLLPLASSTTGADG
jgi:hypothetical protein